MSPYSRSPSARELESPFALDAALRRTAQRWRQWRRALRRGQATDPFVIDEWVTRRSTMEHVGELLPSDPLRDPLLRWMYRLAEQRVNKRWIDHVEAAWNEPVDVTSSPDGARHSPRELMSLALSDTPRREPWLQALFQSAHVVSDAVAGLWARRPEVSRGLVAGLGLPPALDLSTTARTLLERTRPLANELRASGVHELIEKAVASPASEGWPARLTLPILADFVDPELLRGLRLDPGALPALVSPASFARALARLGAALVDAAAPSSQPFVIAHDPRGRARRVMGALLALLPRSPAWARRVLDLGSRRLPNHLLGMSQMLLIEARLQALRCLLHEPAQAGPRRFRAAYVELVGEELGLDVPPELAGVLMRLHDDDHERLLGLVLAARESVDLVERYDEDWFRAPQAVEELRARAATPWPGDPDDAALTSGVDALTRLTTPP